jgi:inorganic triphosphatase YgiF
MKPSKRLHPTNHTTLVLVLPGADPADLLKRLTGTPLLARQYSTSQPLIEVYSDTPDHRLLERGITCCTRQTQGVAKTQWQQRLRVETPSHDALCRYEEWDIPRCTDAPKREIHPRLTVYRTSITGIAPQDLVVCWAVSMVETRWVVHQPQGEQIEVVLKVGRLSADEHSTPVCELALILLTGPPVALLDVAKTLAKTLAVLPTDIGMVQRGHALTRGHHGPPFAAHTPQFKRHTALPGAAAILLTEMLGQCIANLALLHHSDDPEVVHQARVGWRRFKSSVRLFKPVLAIESAPSWEPLAPLQHALGDLRDCDVALTETLPRIRDFYTEGKADRCEDWAQMTQSMERTAQGLRGAVRLALQAPAVGQTLLAILQWLSDLSALSESAATENTPLPSPHDWALHRLDHLHRRLRTATQNLGPLEDQHRARILAKRLRYGTEALRIWIPKKLGQRWGEEASRWQTTLGASRDMARASALAAEAGSDPRLVAFLRGAAAVHQLQGAQPKIKKR